MSDFFKNATPGDSTGFMLWKVNNLWQREIKRTLKRYDLTHTQFVILASAYWLSNQNKMITQVEIANFIKIDKMMTSNVIRALIRKKLIDRTEHATDTRAKVIKLTDKGIDILKMSVAEVEDFDRIFFSQLSSSTNFNGELLRILNKHNG
jgi:DNA-binding MarR family transcriptional regulator